MKEERLVLLGRFYDTTQAHIFRGILESAEIPCFVFDENHSATAWHIGIALGGVRIMVLASDYHRAFALASTHMHDFVKDHQKTPPPLIRKPYLKTIIGTIIGFMVGAPSIWRSKKK